jgi:hypothetical protein
MRSRGIEPVLSSRAILLLYPDKHGISPEK